MRSKLALGASAVRIDRHDMRIRDLTLVGHVNFFTDRNVASGKRDRAHIGRVFNSKLTRRSLRSCIRKPANQRSRRNDLKRHLNDRSAVIARRNDKLVRFVDVISTIRSRSSIGHLEHIHRELRAGKRHFKRAVGVDKRQGVLPLTAGNGNGVCCVRDRSGARLFKMEGRTVATNKVLVENISNITPEFRDINRHMVFLLQWNVYIIKPSAPS